MLLDHRRSLVNRNLVGFTPSCGRANGCRVHLLQIGTSKYTARSIDGGSSFVLLSTITGGFVADSSPDESKPRSASNAEKKFDAGDGFDGVERQIDGPERDGNHVFPDCVSIDGRWWLCAALGFDRFPSDSDWLCKEHKSGIVHFG